MTGKEAATILTLYAEQLNTVEVDEAQLEIKHQTQSGYISIKIVSK